MNMDIGEQIQLFQDFLEMHYYDDLVQALQQGNKHINIDFNNLAGFQIDLAQHLLEQPEELLKTAELAIERLNLSGDTKNFFLRVKNLPASQHISIRNIRSKHIGKFIQIEGDVRQKTDVRPQVTSAKFECPSCGNVMNIVQLDHKKFLEPTQCSCGRKGGFRLLSKELVDVQKIVLEEATENLDGGEQPKRFSLLLKHDLVSPMSEKKTNPGSKLQVIGVINEVPINLYSGAKSSYGFDISDTSYDEAKAAERSAARKRSAQKAYSYVSMVDGVVQTHQTWSECESRVKGKSGTRFKKSLDAGNEKEIIKDFGGQ
jgi:replicative DNA helicase Mcm